MKFSSHFSKNTATMPNYNLTIEKHSSIKKKNTFDFSSRRPQLTPSNNQTECSLPQTSPPTIQLDLLHREKGAQKGRRRRHGIPARGSSDFNCARNPCGSSHASLVRQEEKGGRRCRRREKGAVLKLKCPIVSPFDPAIRLSVPPAARTFLRRAL